MSEIILTCHTTPEKDFKFRVPTNHNCYHICGKNVITFNGPYYICGKNVITFKGPYYICGKNVITFKRVSMGYL